MQAKPSAEHDSATTDAVADGLPKPRLYAAVIAVSLGTMISIIDTGSLNIALPTLARELHVSPPSVVLLVTAYQLVLIMTVLPLSALGDRLGHRTLYQYGQVLYLGATLLCFVAHSLPVLIAIRALQALGSAATTSVSSAMVRQIYPQARLGRGMALNTMLATIGSTLAPSLGGLILSHARWPWLFAICLPMGVISLVAGSKALPDPVRRDHPYDVVAAVLCAAMFGLGAVGLEGLVRGFPLALTALLLIAAVVIGNAFIRREAGQPRPVLPVDLLRDPQIGLSSVAGLLGAMASMLMTITLPFRLQHEFGYSLAEAGLVFAAWPLALVVFAPLAGVLSDRFRPGVLGLVGTVMCTAGLLLLAYPPQHPSHFDVMWRLLIISAGSGIFFAPNARHIIFSAPIARAAAAGGLTQTTRLGGQVLGSTVTAGLLAIGVGSGAVPSLIGAALFAVSAVCCVALLGFRRARTPAG